MQQDFFGAGLAFGSVFFFGLVPFIFLALAVPYMVIRLRNEGPEDPQLGTKVGLQFFFSAAILLGLTGATIMAVDLITREQFDMAIAPPQPMQPGGRPMPRPADREFFNTAQRTGVGMILSSILMALVHFLLALALTDRPNWMRVRRTFAGWRFVIHGVVVAFAGTMLIITILQKDAFEPPGFRVIKALFAVLLLWVPCWLINLVLLKVYSWAGADKKRLPTAEAVGLEDMDVERRDKSFD
jgi:hypothetical protein